MQLPSRKLSLFSATALTAIASFMASSPTEAQERASSCAADVRAATVLLASRIEDRDLIGAQLFVESLPTLLSSCSADPSAADSARSTPRNPNRRFAWMLVEIVRETGSTEEALLQLRDALRPNEGVGAEGGSPTPPDGGGGCGALDAIATRFASWRQACNSYLNYKNTQTARMNRLEVLRQEAENKLKNACNRLVKRPNCLPLRPADKISRDGRKELFNLNADLKKKTDAKAEAKKKLTDMLSLAQLRANQLGSAIDQCKSDCPDQASQCRAEKSPNSTCAGF